MILIICPFSVRYHASLQASDTQFNELAISKKVEPATKCFEIARLILDFRGFTWIWHLLRIDLSGSPPMPLPLPFNVNTALVPGEEYNIYGDSDNAP